MEIEKYRRRVRIVGKVDMVWIIGSICAVAFWLGASCPSGGKTGRAARLRNSEDGRPKPIVCNDARNTSGLNLDQNTTRVVLGTMLRGVVPYKEYLSSGEDIWIHGGVDMALTIPQLMAAYAIAGPKRMQMTLKRDIKFTGGYLLVNILLGLGFTIWRAVEGAWIGFSLGALVRSIMIGIVAQFYLKIRNSLALQDPTMDMVGGGGDDPSKEGHFEGDPNHNAAIQVVASPISAQENN